MDAVDLTASDAREQIMALNQGLMISNSTLLTESKANKLSAAEAAAATEAANQAVIDAEALRLGAANDLEGLKALHATETAKAVAKQKMLTDTAQNALTDRDKGSVINDILSSVDDRYKQLVKTQLLQDTSIEYVDGKPVTSIKHGDDVYSSVEAFLDGVKDSEWKHYLKATSLSGAGTKQSNGGSAGKKPQDMTTAERIEFKQNDPVGFKQAFNL